MSLVISGKTYVPAPEGVHDAVCVDVVDLGIVESRFGKKAKVRVVWEIEEEMSDGRRYTIGRRYTPSLHEKAQLFKDLKSWRGKPFTADELEAFDLEAVVGAPCKLVIQHNEVDGTVYGNVTAVLKADKSNKLKPSGQYVRAKDREETKGASNGDSDNGNEWPSDDDAPAEPIPF